MPRLRSAAFLTNAVAAAIYAHYFYLQVDQIDHSIDNVNHGLCHLRVVGRAYVVALLVAKVSRSFKMWTFVNGPMKV